MTIETCWFCRDDRGPESPPGGWVYEDACWRAWHVLAGWGPAGTVVLESRRHFLDLAEADPAEQATFAPTLGRLTSAVKEVVGADRVYIWSTMDAHPHLHVWLIPWSQACALRGPRYLVDSVENGECTGTEVVETAGRLRARLAGTDAMAAAEQAG